MNQIGIRIKWIDVAKAIGIYLIVLGHTLENGILRQVIYSFHVPLFFFLSGLTYHGIRNGILKKRFTRLYLPYVIFSALSILVFTVAAHFLPSLQMSNHGILKNVLGMLYGNARMGNMEWNEPLWFIPCLISIFVLADITEILIEKIPLKFVGGTDGNDFLRIMLSVILLFVSWVFGRYIRTIKLPFGIESACFVFILFQVGIILREKVIDDYISMIRNYRLLAMFFSVIIMAAICFLSRINGPTQVKSIVFGRSIFCLIATSILGIIAVVILSVLAENFRWLQYIGQRTLPILLMHKFPILFFQMIIKPVGRLLEQGDSVAGVVCGVIVGAITVALCLIVNMIIERVFPIAVGTKRRI